MASVPRDFGPVNRLDAEAEGVPGRRTFRLLIANETDFAVLPIEKEQLQALGVAIEQLLAQVDEPAGDGLVPSGLPETTPTLEFRVTRLGLGFDETSDLFVLIAYEGAAEDDDPPDFICRANRSMMRAFGKRIDEVVNAGRPRCPLCSAPINQGEAHVCARANGHFKVT